MEQTHKTNKNKSDRRMGVKIQKHVTDLQVVKYGVPQESV